MSYDDSESGLSDRVAGEIADASSASGTSPALEARETMLDNVTYMEGRLKKISEQAPPFGTGWERSIASLESEDTLEARETLKWLKANRGLLGEFDTSNDILLEMHQFHDAFHHQMDQEKVLAEIGAAEKFRQHRYTYCPETDSAPTPEQDDSIWAGRRLRHMLYMNFLLEQKGHCDPVFNDKTFNAFGDLADMVYPDMLFNGRYPNSGIIHKPPFEQGVNEHVDWNRINDLKQAYADTHLGMAPGNSVIRFHWTPEEETAAETRGAIIMEELRSAYGAPEGLNDLDITQLKALRARYGTSIKDIDARKPEMTLEYLDRRLSWISSVFDQDTHPSGATGIIPDQLRTQLGQDLILIVASALQNMQFGEFNHAQMIKHLVSTRLSEGERTDVTAKNNKTYENQVELAIKHVRAAETSAIERAKRDRQDAIVSSISRQAILQLQVA